MTGASCISTDVMDLWMIDEKKQNQEHLQKIVLLESAPNLQPFEIIYIYKSFTKYICQLGALRPSHRHRIEIRTC